MTQFSEVPRVPPIPASNRRQARARRFSNAFRTYGGDGTENVTHRFTNQGYEVVSATGSGTEPIVEVLDLDNNVIAAVDDLGSAAPVRNDTVLNSNTTLNTTQLNQVISIEPSADLKITLPPNTDLRSGTWISFQDVSGNATANNIIVDPNNASSGFELNGGTGTAILVNTDYGIGTVRLVKDSAGNTNWFTEQTGAISPGTGGGGGFITSNANITMSVGDIGVLSNNNSVNRRVYLPDATLTEGQSITVLKRQGAGTKLSIYGKSGSGQTVEGSTYVNTGGTGTPHVIVISDGSNWWKVTGITVA
jgi:hypothetical protein